MSDANKNNIEKTTQENESGLDLFRKRAAEYDAKASLRDRILNYKPREPYVAPLSFSQKVIQSMILIVVVAVLLLILYWIGMGLGRFAEYIKNDEDAQGTLNILNWIVTLATTKVAYFIYAALGLISVGTLIGGKR